MLFKPPLSWVFGFPQVPVLPEQLTSGKEREYLSWFFKNIGFTDGAITDLEIDEYVRAYSAPGAMSANFEWFRAFGKDAEQNKQSLKTKLSMPVLTLGGEKTMGPVMVQMAKTVANDVQGGIIPECGHWIAEEKPEYLLDKLGEFLP